jgi:hypothetical protein
LNFVERCHIPKFSVIILKYDSVGIPVFAAICDTVNCWCHCTKAFCLCWFFISDVDSWPDWEPSSHDSWPLLKHWYYWTTVDWLNVSFPNALLKHCTYP